MVLDDSTVYLEDIDPTIPTTPRKKVQETKEPTSSTKKNKFHDYDPYRLPDIDLEGRIAQATSSSAPDPRLATEEELRSFIENMRPEDFDVTSSAFRDLPVDVQYEIVGDLRLKSRQTSYTRLQQMLKSAPTPLDFSKQQIKNLKQRNSLTQQLLATTDDIGKAHISIPVRIASERNREYMLIRNEGATGGWILGIRDGTKQKPILIDHEPDEPQMRENRTIEEDSEDDDDMEEVNMLVGLILQDLHMLNTLSRPTVAAEDIDPDLRDFNRQTALTAIARRYSPKPLVPLSTKAAGKAAQIPLFDLDDDEDFSVDPLPVDHWKEDEELAFAIQESLEYSNKASLSVNGSSSSRHVNEIAEVSNTAGSPSRLETALSIANAGPSRLTSTSSSTSFGQPFLLTTHKSPPISNSKTVSPPFMKSPPPSSTQNSPHVSHPQHHFSPSSISTKSDPNAAIITHPPKTLTFESPAPSTTDAMTNNAPPHFPETLDVDEDKDDTQSAPPVLLSDDEDDDMEEISVSDPHINTANTEREPDPSENHIGRGTSQPMISQSRPPSPEELFSDDDESRPLTPPVEERDWDPAHEMNPDAEEGDFAQFVSQVKGRDIDDVRREIDEEIASLNNQRKNAMRDAEDINQQMVNQIMVRSKQSQ